jgi:hypothetical protein
MAEAPANPGTAAQHIPEKVALVLSDKLAIGHAANVSACLAAGLSGAMPTWAGRSLRDEEGLESVASSHLPIIVLRADMARMAALCERLGPDTPRDGWLSLFPDYAQDLHSADSYWSRHERMRHRETALLGIGLAGSRRWVNSLVGSLPILR